MIVRRAWSSGLELDILWDVDDDGTRPACESHGECAPDHGLDVLHGLHEERVLRDRADEAEHVGLLEGVAAHERRRHLARDRHDGDTVHVRAREPGHEIRRAGTRGGDAHTDASGRARVPVGHVRRALLVTDEDVVDPRMVRQCVIQRKACAAGVAKDDRCARALERAPSEVGAALLGRCGVPDRMLCQCRHRRPPPFSQKSEEASRCLEASLSPYGGCVASLPAVSRRPQ